jgi:hypothetical protein
MRANKLSCICVSEQFHHIYSVKIYNIIDELTTLSTSHLSNVLMKVSISLIQNFAKFDCIW